LYSAEKLLHSMYGGLMDGVVVYDDM
jgi:hypothetical protein